MGRDHSSTPRRNPTLATEAVFLAVGKEAAGKAASVRGRTCPKWEGIRLQAMFMPSIRQGRWHNGGLHQRTPRVRSNCAIDRKLCGTVELDGNGGTSPTNAPYPESHEKAPGMGGCEG